jgi:hypothetical protein
MIVAHGLHPYIKHQVIRYNLPLSFICMHLQNSHITSFHYSSYDFTKIEFTLL